MCSGFMCGLLDKLFWFYVCLVTDYDRHQSCLGLLAFVYRIIACFVDSFGLTISCSVLVLNRYETYRLNLFPNTEKLYCFSKTIRQFSGLQNGILLPLLLSVLKLNCLTACFAIANGMVIWISRLVYDTHECILCSLY